MIPIALFKKFLSKQFIASVEVSNIARCSSKSPSLITPETMLTDQGQVSISLTNM